MTEHPLPTIVTDQPTPTVPGWSLQWASPIMPACAFWYYRTEAEARAAAAQMAERCSTLVRPVQLPATFTAWMEAPR
jgi:hypothetical protein